MNTQTGIPKAHLDAAQMATFLRKAETDTAKQFVSALMDQTLEHEAMTKPRQRRRRKDDMECFKRANAAFAADLIDHNGSEKSDGFMYRPTDRAKLSETLVSSRHFEKLREFWQDMNLIELMEGFRKKIDFEGPTNATDFAKATRMRATPELMQMAERFGIYSDNISEHFPKQAHLISLVTIRSEKERKPGFKQKAKNIRIKGAEYDRQVATMQELNAIYQRHAFNLSDTPQLYRLFNRGDLEDFDFNMGGRLYCASDDNWQSRSSEERRLIQIDDEPTVEVDVRASHLAILYGINGKHLDTDADPYHIDGIEREVVKMVFTAWCGLGKPPVRWPKKQSAEYAERHGRELNKTYKLKDVVKAIQDRHPVMAKIEYPALDWSKLQFVESACFVSAMLTLADPFDVPALPVHDSLIVRERDAQIAKDMLGQAYERRLRFRPVIRET